MALILAIEPDRRQASHLTALVRGRLRAEFIVGDSAERALAALGDRVPDLVLTTALLSPRDETALTERLRALDGKAAHVQTLTIPVLASPARRTSKAGGMLTSLLGDKSDEEPVEGCDPAMFAEQCREYLDRAASERAHRLDSEPPIEPAAAGNVVVAPERTESFAPIVEPDPVKTMNAAAPVAEADEVADSTPSTALIVSPSKGRRRSALFASDDEDAPRSLMAAVAAFAEEEPVILRSESPVFVKPADDPGMHSAANDGEKGDTDFDFQVDLSLALDDPSCVRTANVAHDQDESSVNVYELDSSILADSQFEPATAVSDLTAYSSLEPEVHSWPTLAGWTAGAPAVEERMPAEAAPPAPAEHVERHKLDEWRDIIEALRRDAQPVAGMHGKPVKSEEAKTAEPEASAATPAPPEPEVPQPAPIDQGSASPTPTRKQSVEDEWGFFDPDRAGFAALLAKLEEITEDDTPKRKAQRK